MKENWVYRRGDLYLANLGVPVGSKQGGVRPVVVLQNDVGKLLCADDHDCSADIEN